MGIFDKDLITRDTSLQKFCNLWKTAVKGEFNDLYRKYDGDLSRVSSIYNGVLDKYRQKFAEHGIYYPWLFCTPIADIYPSESKVLVTILYSEDPIGYTHENRKIFLQITIPISQLKDIIYYGNIH